MIPQRSARTTTENLPLLSDRFAVVPGQRGLQGNKVALLLAKLAIQPEGIKKSQ